MAGRLLLVDDEAVLVDLLKKYLERMGYEVDACTSPEEALTLYQADPQRYALVLTDLTLPGINGEEMLDRMRASYPGLKAIVSSGYHYQPRSKQIGFLQKPYLPKMLADSIEKILGEKSPPV
jgi:DNA-binding NtrC family response regulator